MIIFTKGNIFEANVEAFVNPVNCMGVMGAGLALEFKQRFPENYRFYRDQCIQGNVDIGTTLISGDKEKKYIINFPTKFHWKNPSDMEYIDRGLVDLARKINGYEIESIAVPALGCGLGGLKWQYVKQVIEDKLHDRNFKLSKTEPFESLVRIYVYEPHE